MGAILEYPARSGNPVKLRGSHIFNNEHLTQEGIKTNWAQRLSVIIATGTHSFHFET